MKTRTSPRVDRLWLPIVTVVLCVQAGACERRIADRPGAEPRVTNEGLRPVNGTELFVKRLGAGPPVIVVHGGPVLEHGYLLPHLTPLARSFELIFYDQRLSGRSSATADSASIRLDTFVDDIEALRQVLELDRVHLLGHSWGGLLALRYAIEHADRLSSLVLVSPMSASSALWQDEARLLATRVTAEDSLEREALRASPALAERRPDAVRQMLLLSFRTQFHDRSRIGELELYVPENYAERSRQFAFMTPDLMSFDFHDQLDGILVPTLLLYGSDEPGRTLGGAALSEHLPNDQFTVIADAGHFPFLEQPQAFLATVQRFLHAHR